MTDMSKQTEALREAQQPAQQCDPAEDGVCEKLDCPNHGPAQQKEPFGYFRYDLRLDAWVQNREGRPGTAFYTSPPAQRTWVGLTDEDIASLDLSAVTVKDAISDVRAVEAKLKEKNT